MEWRVDYYVKSNGESPVRDFILSLPPKHSAKVLWQILPIIKGGLKMVNTPSRPWSELKKELLSNTEIKAECEAIRPQYELIEQIIIVRTLQGVTQEELAKRVGTKQSNISRFESGNYNPSLEFIQKLAQGLGKELHITLK